MACGSCVILPSMFRRAQAIVVVLALLAAPLALYARGTADDMSDCNGMCCPAHHHHAPQPAAAAQPAPDKDNECHHAEAASAMEASHTCAFHCAMHGKPHSMNFGLLAPIAPTKPSDIASIRIAIDATRAADASTDLAPSGFHASLFQPPRA